MADSSLQVDQRVKAPLYASAGIPELWIVDLPHRAVHTYREPESMGYRLVRTLRPGERVAPLAFPERELEVAELLG